MALCIEPLQLKPVWGSETDVSISPYDQPKSMTAFYSKDKDILDLQFRYISEEPAKIVRLSHAGYIGLGRNSNRVHSISISLAGIDEYSHLKFWLHDQLAHLERQGGKSFLGKILPRKNYQSLRDFIDGNISPLIKYLESAR